MLPPVKRALAEEARLEEEAVRKCELDYARKHHKHLVEHYEKCIARMKSALFGASAREESVANEELFAEG